MKTIHLYFARRYFFWFFGITLGFMGLIVLFDLVETLRRTVDLDISVAVLLSLIFLRLPYFMLEILPLMALFAAMGAVWQINRNHGFIIARTGGYSFYKSMMPMVVVACFLGFFATFGLSPLASFGIKSYERLEANVFKGRETLQKTQRDIRLNEQLSDGYWRLIHADKGKIADSAELYGVTVFMYGSDNQLLGSIHGEKAVLKEGNIPRWQILNAWANGDHFQVSNDRLPDGESPKNPPKETGYKGFMSFQSTLSIETGLTKEKVEAGLLPPDAVSFYELPEHIKILEKSLQESTSYQLKWHKVLATGLLMMAMALWGGSFLHLNTRGKGRAFIAVSTGVFSALFLYFVFNVLQALGLSALSPWMAVWFPYAMVFAIASLLVLRHN